MIAYSYVNVWLDSSYMFLSVQSAKLSVLLISLLMRLLIYGSLHKKLVRSLRATTRLHHLLWQSKMDPKQDRLYPMFIFILSLEKVVILRRMMRYMML
ncbi:hypothetical protein PHAVU_006G082311 [Phaseolus vulgaris]